MRATFAPAWILALFLVPSTVTADMPAKASEKASEKAPASQEDLLQLPAVQKVMAGSPFIGTGNPALTRHPATPEQCREKLTAEGVEYRNPAFEDICGHPYMAPLYDPSKEKPEDAKACIDQFEFPNQPCAYPIVWVRADEAAALCEAAGKRMCDAHEWEGACAGALEPPDYRFDLAGGGNAADALSRMRTAHNRAASATKAWSYGPAYQPGICGAASVKTAGCNGGDWKGCGSNTYPTGYFPGCRSALGVYDLHGNAAEHMNLPLAPDQMASRGSKSLGVTEMKGSWFIFDTYRAHDDWCRWRAPFWHGSRVLDPKSHHNYHLGFRCCETVSPQTVPSKTVSSTTVPSNNPVSPGPPSAEKATGAAQ